METDQNSLLERIRQMEEKMKELIKNGVRVQQEPVSVSAKPSPQKRVEEEERLPKAKAEELTDLIRHWKDIRRNLSPQMKFALQKASLMVNTEGTALKIMFPKEMNVESGYLLEKPERIETLKQEISRQTGREIELEVGILDQSKSEEDMIDLGCIHMDVTIED